MSTITVRNICCVVALCDIKNFKQKQLIVNRSHKSEEVVKVDYSDEVNPTQFYAHKSYKVSPFSVSVLKKKASALLAFSI